MRRVAAGRRVVPSSTSPKPVRDFAASAAFTAATTPCSEGGTHGDAADLAHPDLAEVVPALRVARLFERVEPEAELDPHARLEEAHHHVRARGDARLRKHGQGAQAPPRGVGEARRPADRQAVVAMADQNRHVGLVRRIDGAAQDAIAFLVQVGAAHVDPELARAVVRRLLLEARGAGHGGVGERSRQGGHRALSSSAGARRCCCG